MSNKNKKALGLIGRWKKKNELMSYLPSTLMGAKNYNFAGKVVKQSLKSGNEGGARLYVDEQLRKLSDQTKDTPVSQEYVNKSRKRLGYKPQ